jgi:hypothetical protein
MDKDALGLTERLAAARAKAKVLAEKTDDLNEVLRSAEDAISALKLGVPGWVGLEGEREDSDDATETSLQWGRFEGKWCLAIVEGRPDMEDWHATPLLRCSRTLRVDAARKLPELLDNIIARVDEEISEVEKSALAASDFVVRLRTEGA